MTPEPASKLNDLDRYLMMTLLVTAFYFTGLWAFQIPIWTLTLAALLCDSRLLRHWGFWSVLCAVMVAATIQMYLPQGNDYFLILYLALTATIAMHHNNPLGIIRLNAPWLIGIVFSLATIWKIISPSFTSGKFFAYSLLFEERLAPITLFLARLPPELYLQNRDALDTINLQAGFTVHTNTSILIIAQTLTWLAISVEGLVALAFMIPFGPLRRHRDSLLLLFFVGTYLILPVPSFGMALATLGYVQAPNRLYKRLYLGSYILMPLTSLRLLLLPFP